MNLNKKWFSLIELLVVITIMWILAVGGISTYTSYLQRARDNTRLTDINELNSWVNLYYQDRWQYPNTWDNWTSTSVTSVNSYVENLRQDPNHWINCDGSTCVYAYKVKNSSSGITLGAYELSTAFESSNSVERYASNVKDWWNDEKRLELWLEISGIETTVATDRGSALTSGGGTITNSLSTIWIFRDNTGAWIVKTINP